MLLFLKNILQLIISPDNGWEDVVHERSGTLARRGMMWMVAVAALSVFVKLFYSNHMSLTGMFQFVVVVAVAFLATFFIGDFILTQWLPRINDGVLDTCKSRLIAFYSVSLLSLQVILSNVLPLTFAILELWPIYVVIILWRAMAVLDLPEVVTGKYLLIVILAFIVPSQLLLRVFNSVILQ